MSDRKKTTFSSKVGLIMAAAGSAVGLGNIWKFPYIAGENGGGAFLVVYLLCVLLFGMPLLMTEFMIGKRSGKSAYGAFHALSGNNRWQWLSWLCMLTAFVIMGFYFVVTGWCFNYLVEAVTNALGGLSAQELNAHFDTIQSSNIRMIGFGILPVLLTAGVLLFDVNTGIERLSKVLMPLLLILMLLMAGVVLMMDGSSAGMRFFFRFDFAQITPRVVMEAMGQCFFSLSIGMGALITYGAYMPKGQNVIATSVQVIVLDTIVALLAGVIIFPAVFAFGFDPAEGPELVFVVLPAIFEKMTLPWLSSVLFFALLCIAAITSTISLMEVVVAFICEATAGKKHPLNRRQAVLITSALVIALLVACVFVPEVFNYSDLVSACVMMPLGALGMAVFVGWRLHKIGKKSVQPNEKWIKRWTRMFYLFVLRFIVPLAILLIVLNGLGVL